LLQKVHNDVNEFKEVIVNKKEQKVTNFSSTEDETSILIHTDEKGKSKLVDQHKYRSKTVDYKKQIKTHMNKTVDYKDEKTYGNKRNKGFKKI